MTREILVKLSLFATLREKYKMESINIKCNGTLEDLFKKASELLGENFLKDVYDDNGNFRGDRIITINGRNLKDLKYIPALKNGNNIAIFPPIAGG